MEELYAAEYKLADAERWSLIQFCQFYFEAADAVYAMSVTHPVKDGYEFRIIDLATNEIENINGKDLYNGKSV